MSKPHIYDSTKDAILAVLVFASFIALIACSSQPKVNELKITADPQVELSRVGANLKTATLNQVDVLSPKSFAQASDTLQAAYSARAKNADQKDVLYKVALAQAYIDQANSNAGVASQLLASAVLARHDALIAGSQEFFAQDLEKADNELTSVTRKIEINDTSKAEPRRQALELLYRDLELKSIKHTKLDPAHATIETATKEGAKKLTPETYSWATKIIAEDNAVIEKDRHNTSAVDMASQEASNAANRLLRMVREAKGSAQKNPEQLAKQAEANRAELAQGDKDLDQAELALTKSQGRLATATTKNADLESQVLLDREYAKARLEFTENEADIYKQGDSLLLRLKGMSFANNKSDISAENYAILAKVQKVVADIGNREITVEGHTDSLGQKKMNLELSKERAHSVQEYLVSNKTVAVEKISSQGYGDSKPIATNKTALGRAQNRRVDIIIKSERL